MKRSETVNPELSSAELKRQAGDMGSAFSGARRRGGMVFGGTDLTKLSLVSQEEANAVIGNASIKFFIKEE